MPNNSNTKLQKANETNAINTAVNNANLLAKTKEIKVIKAGKRPGMDLIINPLASPVLKPVSKNSSEEISLANKFEDSKLNISSFGMESNVNLNEILGQIYCNFDEEIEELKEMEAILNSVKSDESKALSINATNILSNLLDNNASNNYSSKHKPSESSDIDEGYKSCNSSISDKTYLISHSYNSNSETGLNKYGSKKAYATSNSVTIDLIKGQKGNSKGKNNNVLPNNANGSNVNNVNQKGKKLK